MFNCRTLMPKLNTDPASAADIQALHQRLDSSGTDQNILTSRRPQARAALTSFPMYMSIRFFHFAGILSSTTYSLLSPSILTLVPLFRPIDSRSADTAMAFIPGVILSPHAPTLGSPWPCFGSELNAVAVTLRVRCCSRGIFWEVEQEIITEMLRRKNMATNRREFIVGYHPSITCGRCRFHLPRSMLESLQSTGCDSLSQGRANHIRGSDSPERSDFCRRSDIQSESRGLR